MILNDRQIAWYAQERGMIDPFQPSHVRLPDRCSYGLGSFGYDPRAIPHYRVYRRPTPFLDKMVDLVDPNDFSDATLVDVHPTELEPLVLNPGEYALTATVERFQMPDNVMGIVLGKSTLARCGLMINSTPLEPGWCGQITIEIANLNTLPVILRQDQGICQVIFLAGERPRRIYDSTRKYQNQVGIVNPIGG